MSTGLTKFRKWVLTGFALTSLAIPACVLFARSLDWRRDFLEAEPLVEPVWNLAACMSDFAAKHGRPPTSIDEMAGSPDGQDYSELKRYAHEFTATGPTRLFLRVNRRFAFSISEDFTPEWARFSGVLEKP